MLVSKTTIGSICSGIEAASVAWKDFPTKFEWFSEIAPFPCTLLEERYPDVHNVGDMNNIPALIRERKIAAPDMICGGTPCQAFSLAGWKNGLNDDRGNLTLKFVDIIEANDEVRTQDVKAPTIVFWENVEGVLTDKTNAFGCLVSSLAGLSNVVQCSKWPTAGVIYGKKRNVAWRIIDAKYFGIPQQRRRLYLLAGGIDFHPENVLFEVHRHESSTANTALGNKQNLRFQKQGHSFEVFREYTDCLYSSYGTKWNGNAAAYNGSLYVVQDEKIRRFSPLEAERLMGFPDNYTLVRNATRTSRYQAIGNSWAIPVVRWIGERIFNNHQEKFLLKATCTDLLLSDASEKNEYVFIRLGTENAISADGLCINSSTVPENKIPSTLESIVSPETSDELYISPVGCQGIIRRKQERGMTMNLRLQMILSKIASQMSSDEIEQKSRVQRRGRFSEEVSAKQKTPSEITQEQFQLF